MITDLQLVSEESLVSAPSEVSKDEYERSAKLVNRKRVREQRIIYIANLYLLCGGNTRAPVEEFYNHFHEPRATKREFREARRLLLTIQDSQDWRETTGF